eukprot:scaffold10246_cov18-Tisochrysis_lutea.AAC.1
MPPYRPAHPLSPCSKKATLEYSLLYSYLICWEKKEEMKRGRDGDTLESVAVRRDQPRPPPLSLLSLFVPS